MQTKVRKSSQIRDLEKENPSLSHLFIDQPLFHKNSLIARESPIRSVAFRFTVHKSRLAHERNARRVIEKIARGEKFYREKGGFSAMSRAVQRSAESRSAVVKRSRHDSVAIYRRGNRSLAPGKVNRVLTMEPPRLTATFSKKKTDIYFRYGESLELLSRIRRHRLRFFSVTSMSI